MGLSKEDVREIIQLLDDLKAAELHLRTRHYTLTLRREGDGWVSSAGPTGGAVRDSGAEQPEQPPDEPDERLVAVRAALAGTFYRAPKPGAPPYVEVGGHVEEETVVGILETMKLMNPVNAGARGRVAEICAANDALVEPGAVLMRIAPEE